MAKEQRLIDGNELKRRIIAFATGCHSEVLTVDSIMMMLNQADTVDAVEVVRGRWVKKWHDNNLIGHEYEECSVCGSCVISDTEKFWDCNYCPQCGAKMDGERRDGE